MVSSPYLKLDLSNQCKFLQWPLVRGVVNHYNPLSFLTMKTDVVWQGKDILSNSFIKKELTNQTPQQVEGIEADLTFQLVVF